MSDDGKFTIHLDQLEDYSFRVRFDWPDVPELDLDEPAPLGGSSGPNASRLLAAAVGNCLSASLMFCLSRQQAPAESVRATVTGRMARNDRGRLRVGGLQVQITVADTFSKSPRLARCLDLFEDFCVVTASIREGVPVTVSVATESGDVLKEEV